MSDIEDLPLLAECPQCGHTEPLPAEMASAFGHLADDEPSTKRVTIPLGICLDVIVDTVEWYHAIAVDLANQNAALRELAAETLDLNQNVLGIAARLAASHRLVASRTSKHFHRPECEWAQYFLGMSDCLEFPSHDDAVASGRKPCKTCRS